MTKSLFFIASLLAPLSNFANASDQYEVSKSEVNFKAIGKPGFLRINGEKGNFTGVLTVDQDKMSGTFTSKLELLTTDMDMRDEHMHKEYLETPKFPEATLTIKDAPFKKDDYEIKAQLSLHGKSKEIPLSIELEDKGQGLVINAEFEITLSDFDIKIPTYAGITVAKTVEIRIKGEGVKK